MGWFERIALKHVYSVQFSRSVGSNSLRPHELQYARPPCPSSTPGVHPNPSPLSRWCHPTISSSVICEIDHQSRFDTWDRVLRAGALGWPWGTGWGERWEGGSGWGTHVHAWRIHVNVWQRQPQCCKVISLQLKKKKYKVLTLYNVRNIAKVKYLFI